MYDNEMLEIFGKIEEKAMKDLKVISEKPELSPAEWERIKNVMCMLKDMKKCESMTGDIGGYSERYEPDGYSQRRGRSMSTGRYISRDYRSGYRQHSIKDRMIDNLERMMDEASSDYERETIKAEIRKLEMDK